MVDATRLGAWLRSGEGIGWLAAGIIPNSLYRLPFFYLFLACMCILLLFLSMSFLFCFVLSLELCRCSSDLFLPSRPRTVLATTYITNNCMYWVWLRPDRLIMLRKHFFLKTSCDHRLDFDITSLCENSINY